MPFLMKGSDSSGRERKSQSSISERRLIRVAIGQKLEHVLSGLPVDYKSVAEIRLVKIADRDISEVEEQDKNVTLNLARRFDGKWAIGSTGVTTEDAGNYHLGLFDETGNFLACHMIKVKLLEAPPPEKDQHFRFANRMALLDKKASAASPGGR